MMRPREFTVIVVIRTSLYGTLLRISEAHVQPMAMPTNTREPKAPSSTYFISKSFDRAVMAAGRAPWSRLLAKFITKTSSMTI